MSKNFVEKTLASVLLAGLAAGAIALAQAPSGAPAPEGRGRGAGRGPGRAQVTVPGIFIDETWKRPANEPGQVPWTQANVASPNLELHVYGADAKNLTISGAPDSQTGPLNLWTGLCTAPVAVTLRDKDHYVDLTGLAKVRWITRASGFHEVRPVIKLADGTFLVGDHAESSTTTFLESEFAFFGLRWIKLDPVRVVTTGVYGPVGDAASWIEHPDLSKVDEVGFVDLTPGTGHGSGGWINVGHFQVYGKPVNR
jgi:hypothetical protein